MSDLPLQTLLDGLVQQVADLVAERLAPQIGVTPPTEPAAFDPDDPNLPYLTRRGAARRLNISPSKFSALRTGDNPPPFVDYAGDPRFPREHLDEWAEGSLRDRQSAAERQAEQDAEDDEFVRRALSGEGRKPKAGVKGRAA